MAINIVVSYAKKIPADQEYSSKQASISISAEISDIGQVVSESQKLYLLAEQSVNQKLKVNAVKQQVVQRPSQPSAPFRRSPSPITDSQHRFLSRLIQQGNHSVDEIIQDYQVGDLRNLSCRDAAILIDKLKVGAV